nr:GNAT family N-acetyltransferase [Acidimicrobiia bacterium]
DWYLQGVAVDEAFRGAGIGSLLLDHAEEVAATTGARRLALDVDVENDAARSLYERRGMTIEATSPSGLLRSDRVHRMTKAL